jgi:hypothetical protein
MSAFACAEVRELAPEIAVNIVGGPERAEALDHMSECGPCRAYVAELAEAADALTLLAAEAEPPPGFERRVLAAIGSGRRRSWRRLALVAASVAAATAIVSVVGVRLVEGGDDSRPVVAPAASKSVETVTMRSDAGIEVGSVHVSDGHPSVVVVTVDYGIGDGAYNVAISSPQHADEVVGTIRVEGGRGSWGGTTRLPPEGTISVVGGGGEPLCSASLPSA